MPGDNDLYVLARRVLLDALEALQAHRGAIILVGAQAIYLHTGEAELAVAPFTTDADLALDPSALGQVPALEQAMQDAGFVRLDQPGIWKGQRDGVTVDLLVPAAVGGPGRRGARLEGHADNAARKAQGLEAVLVDRQPMIVSVLEETDHRHIEVNIAGPAALLVAKLYKIWERRDSTTRLDSKDALDIYRLLQAIPTQALAEGFTTLFQAAQSREVAVNALTYLKELFGEGSALGTQMAAQAVVPLDDPDIVAASCVALTQDLLTAVRP